MKATRRVTIRDVARSAGVSPTTVSHVLNGQGRVRKETRSLVEEAAASLGYRANPLAQNLRRETFGAIGLCLPPGSMNFQFYVDMAMAASSTAFDAGCGLTLLPPVETPSDLLKLPLDGIIVADPLVGDPLVEVLSGAQVPLVLCEAAATRRGSKIHVIDNQHELMVGELLDHLVAQGVSDIAVVAADPKVWWGRLVNEAVASWSARVGVVVRTATLAFPSPPESARAAIDGLLDVAVPEALIVAQQGLGSVALASLADRGLSVPGDLLLASFSDGPDLLATSPQVTAIDVNPAAIGRLAATILLQGSSKRTWRRQPQLHLRPSTTRFQ